MIGFVLGTLCLFGLIKVIRRGRHFGPAFAYGGGCGGGGYDDGPPWSRHDHHHDHPWGHHGRRGGWGGWRGQNFMLRSLFERLDTTPGQEKVIASALEDLRNVGRGVKDDLGGARSELATAMRGESFDEVALGGATARMETAVDTVRKAGIDAFAKVHSALDERQRQILADLLERGPRGFSPFR
jgi:hypothetical protein